MRVFATCPDQTGSPKTIRINLNQLTTTTQLLVTIAKQFHVNKQMMIVKLKNQIIALRILENWPISFYPLKNGARLSVDIIKGASDSPFQSPFLTPISHKLSQIQEEFEGEAQYESSISIKNRSQQSFRDLGWDSYLDRSLQKFLQAVRQKSLESVSNILKQQPQISNQSYLEKSIVQKNKYLLNELGQCGKSALHWAIHQKDQDMVEFLLIKSSNPNTVSLDHYTPLQLSISLRLNPIFQTLINHPKIDINQVTNKGTALHMAANFSHINFIQKLIINGADIDIMDGQGKTARQLCKQKKIDLTQIVKKRMFQIPYIGRGKIYKVSSLSKRLKSRLLLVNPFTDQFIIYNEYKQIEDIIKISMIRSAYNIPAKGWLMKKQYYYFEITIKSLDNMIFATKNKQICQKWIEQIQKAISFVLLKEIPKIKKSEQLIQSIDDTKNQIKIHKINTQKKISHPKITMFSIKPMNQQEVQDIESEYQKSIDKGISEKMTSSMMAISEKGSQVGDLRQSDILGSIVNQSQLKFNLKPSPIRKDSDDTLKDSILSSNLESFQPIVAFKDFQMLRELGNGSFGKVFLARHQKSQQVYALKVLSKKKLMAKKQLKYALSQASILKKLQSPFIVQLYYSFQTPSNLYMALDFCPYGDLAELICDQGRLSQQITRFYVAQIILAIQYLHQHEILYRDLKPQNILIAKNGFLKLTDFGLSKQNNFAMSFCGSPAYLSPEMLQKKGVGYEADLYGIGCVLYQMLVGEPPYFDDNIDKLFSNIKNGKLKYPSFLSKSAKSLIGALLQRDKSKRIGSKNIQELKNHDFFQKFKWDRLQKMQVDLPAQLITKFSQIQQMTLEVIEGVNFKDIDYDGPHVKINRIKGFTFVKQSVRQFIDGTI